MKFVIEKGIFLKLLSDVCSVATKKTSQDSKDSVILQNIKIEVKDNFLYLTGTDSDAYIKTKIAVEDATEGATTVSASLIYDFVKKVEEGSQIECNFSKEENSLFLTSGKGNFKFLCLDADLYPNFEVQDMPTEFKMSPKDFVNIIEKTRSSICDEAARYYLSGLFIHTVEEDGEIILSSVSTDGHRLSLIKTKNINFKEGFQGVIIHKKILPEIKKILYDVEDEEVTFSLSKTKIKIETSNKMIISKLIDADFPDYQRVIPQSNDKILKVNKKVISSLIDRVSVFADDSHKGVKFILSDNNLILEASSPDRGSALEETKVDFPFDSKIEIGFNSRFVLDIMSQIESDNVIIYFKDNSSAIMVKGEEEINNIFVLMPIRI